MDIRGIEGALKSQQAERPQHRVVKGGAEFQKMQPEAFVSAGSTNPAGPGSAVTKEEREYFAALFPESSEEIGAHATYSPKGLTSPARMGQMVDRKG
ncbi:MAG: hypothetical protein WB699_11795 [Bacteroidota bacterium]